MADRAEACGERIDRGGGGADQAGEAADDHRRGGRDVFARGGGAAEVCTRTGDSCQRDDGGQGSVRQQRCALAGWSWFEWIGAGGGRCGESGSGDLRRDAAGRFQHGVALAVSESKGRVHRDQVHPFPLLNLLYQVRLSHPSLIQSL